MAVNVCRDMTQKPHDNGGGHDSALFQHKEQGRRTKFYGGLTMAYDSHPHFFQGNVFLKLYRRWKTQKERENVKEEERCSIRTSLISTAKQRRYDRQNTKGDSTLITLVLVSVCLCD